MKLALLAVYNEIYKRILIAWDYKFNILMQLVMLGIIFIGASFFLGNGQFNPQQLATLFLGYIVWLYARIVIMSTSADLVGEAQAGTLEQMYMAPVPAEILALGRTLATLIVTTVMVCLISGILLLLLGIHIPLRLESVPILLLTLVGLFGFTLMLGGAALVFKQVEGLADLFQNLLLFLTGSLLPISRFPGWLAAISKTLPITQGIDVLRGVTLNNQSFAATWLDGGLPWLIINSFLYLVAGWLIFKWCEKVARQRGTLSHY